MIEQLANLPNWKFMNEPIWRWFVFIIAMGLIMAAWAAVLRTLRAAI